MFPYAIWPKNKGYSQEQLEIVNECANGFVRTVSDCAINNKFMNSLWYGIGQSLNSMQFDNFDTFKKIYCNGELIDYKYIHDNVFSIKRILYPTYTLEETTYNYIPDNKNKISEAILSKIIDFKTCIVGGSFALDKLMKHNPSHSKELKQVNPKDIDVFATCNNMQEFNEVIDAFKNKVKDEHSYSLYSQDPIVYPEEFDPRKDYVKHVVKDFYLAYNFNFLILGLQEFLICEKNKIDSSVRVQIVCIKKFDTVENMFDKISDVPACVSFKKNDDKIVFYTPTFFKNFYKSGTIPSILCHPSRVWKVKDWGWNVFSGETLIQMFINYYKYSGQTQIENNPVNQKIIRDKCDYLNSLDTANTANTANNTNALY